MILTSPEPYSPYQIYTKKKVNKVGFSGGGNYSAKVENGTK
jgi:hypothetical protein